MSKVIYKYSSTSHLGSNLPCYIAKYSLAGNLIETYLGYEEISKELGVSIKQVGDNIRVCKTYRGFQWNYSYINEFPKEISANFKFSKSYNIEGVDYDSSKEICDLYKISKATLHRRIREDKYLDWKKI